MAESDYDDPKLQEVYRAGLRDKALEELQKDMSDHLEDCKEKSQRIWSKLDRHSWLIGIGLGVIATIEALALIFGRGLISP